MEPPLALAPPPGAEAHSCWLLRVQEKAARTQKRCTQHLQARRRRRIPKSILVDTLFAALDTRNIGAPGRDELNKFALLTGFQGDREDLFEETALLLNKWGSSSAQSLSRAISLRNFAQIVSRTGVLLLSKAELRRTIRFSKAPEVQGHVGAVRSRHVAQHQAHEDLHCGNTVEARDLLVPLCPSLVSRPDSV